MSFISQMPSNLIKNLLLPSLLILSIAMTTGCKDKSKESNAQLKIPRIIQMATSGGQIIRTHLAITPDEQQQGLSGKQPEDFSQHEAMLFIYTNDGIRMFWMPDTYFDLDLFFLDKNLKIIDVHRSLKSHPGRNEPPPIARSKQVYARHVLEMRSDSQLAKSIKIGDTLKWMEKIALSEIESRIRLSQ